MPFQFAPYDNSQSTATIGSLMQEQARIRAAQAERVGAAQAGAITAGGNAAAQAAGNIGQIISAVPQQMQEQRIQQQQQQLRGAQLVNAGLEGQQKTMELGQEQAKIAETAKAKQENETALKIAQGLRDPDPQAREVVLQQIQDPTVQQSARDLMAKRDAQNAAYRKDRAQLAQKFGYQPDIVRTVVALDPLPHALDHFNQMTDGGQNAAKVKQYVDAFATEGEPAKLTEHDPTKELRTGTGELVVAAEPKIQTPAEVETARHNRELERVAALTSGRAAAAQAETIRHNKAMEPGALFGASGAAPAGNLTGDDFLKTLPPGQASEIKAYAEGRRPFPTGMSYAKLQPLIQLVGQYDPSFDAANYNARNKARTDMTSPSGTGGKTINALNTAIQHAGRLSDLIEQLDNYESPLANAVTNPLRTATGSTKVTNFNAVAPQLMKEIERAWRGSGGSTADIDGLIKSIGSNLGKQQQREALGQFVELLKGKLDSTQTQRDNVLGPSAGQDIPVLFKENAPLVDKILTRAGSGEPAAAGKDPLGIR